MSVGGVDRAHVDVPVSLPNIPEVSDYGKITSEQKKLVVELKKGSDRSADEIKDEFLAKEEQKLDLLPQLSDDQKADRLERATNFIDKKIAKLSVDNAPVDGEVGVQSVGSEKRPLSPPGKPADGPPKKRRVGQALRSLHRAEVANSNGLGDFGSLTAEQWSIVRQYRAGDLSYEEAKAQFLDSEEAKLNLLVESNKISEEEKANRLERFSSVIENVLAH